MYEEIINQIRPIIAQRFPYGGINRENAITKIAQHENIDEYAAQEIYQRQFAQAESLFSIDDGMVTELLDIQEDLQEIKGLFCDHLINYTKAKIKELYPDLEVENVTLDYHTVLVLGRPLTSNPEDITTWGDAQIYDPWSDQFYLARDFYAHLENAPEIPFKKLDTMQNGEELVQEYVSAQGKDYLQGIPKINFSSCDTTAQYQAYLLHCKNKYSEQDLEMVIKEAIVDPNPNRFLISFLASVKTFNVNYIYKNQLAQTLLDIAYEQTTYLQENGTPAQQIELAKVIDMLSYYDALSAQECLMQKYQATNLESCLHSAAFKLDADDIQALISFKDIKINDLNANQKTVLDIINNCAERYEHSIQGEVFFNKIKLDQAIKCKELLLSVGAKPSAECLTRAIMPPPPVSGENQEKLTYGNS